MFSPYGLPLAIFYLQLFGLFVASSIQENNQKIRNLTYPDRPIFINTEDGSISSKYFDARNCFVFKNKGKLNLEKLYLHKNTYVEISLQKPVTIKRIYRGQKLVMSIESTDELTTVHIFNKKKYYTFWGHSFYMQSMIDNYFKSDHTEYWAQQTKTLGKYHNTF